MNNFSKLGELLDKPFFSSSDANRKGVSTSLLSYYIKKGLIERVDRGIYRGFNSSIDVDFQWEDLVLTTKSIPGSVVCLTSALALYDLTDEIPRIHWIAISNDKRAPKRMGTKIVRMRNITLGKVEMNIGSESIQIFDLERSIIDAFRYLGKEVAIKAMKRAISINGQNRLDPKKLRNYATEFRINIDQYILAVTT